MNISLIVAMDDAHGIGHHGKLPWRLATDLQRFKARTYGHHVIMGRKTWEAIGRPLPGRVMIVITREQGYQAPGCIVVHSLRDALEIASGRSDEEIFVIGGGELYAQALPLTNRIYLTEVHTVIPADVYFPDINLDDWEIAYSEVVSAGEKDEFPTTFTILERRAPQVEEDLSIF